jgi:hypothetical protein
MRSTYKILDEKPEMKRVKRRRRIVIKVFLKKLGNECE